MRQVELESLYLDSFKSFVQPTEIALSKTVGLKFLAGKNAVEPRLGSNGSGKSTLWDALCWCLYGTGVRGQRASELVSWGKSRPFVRATMQINGEAHTIERSGSPNRLLVDGGAATQADVESLLGLNRDRFLQSVLFGQGVPLFLDLSPAKRGELLDSVLDLSLWMRASEVAGRAMALVDKQITEQQKRISFEEGKLSGLGEEEAVRASYDAWEQQKQAEVEHAIRELEATESHVLKLRGQLEHVQAQLAQQPDESALNDTIRDVQNSVRDAQRIHDDIRFYETHDECPECQHPLSNQFCQHKIEELKAELVTRLGGIELPDAMSNLSSLNHLRIKTRSHVETLTALEGRLTGEINGQLRYVDTQTRRIERTAERENPYAQRLEGLQAAKDACISAIEVAQGEILRLEANRETAVFWKDNFKKVRLFQVQRVLLRLEIETANAAASLGLSEWAIRYVTEVETQSGTTKPGIQVLVRRQGGYDGPWEGFSGGEAQRVRLAVTMGLAAFIQGLAGVSYAFEVWDEPTQYLSQEGIEDLIACLSSRADAYNKVVWLTDHSPLSSGSFQETLYCTKTADGSILSLSPTI